MENEPTPLAVQDPGPFYHGTKAHLRPGDVLQPGYRSNFGEHRKANYIYLTATVDAATWGAELAVGEGPGRIYRVEPTGPIEDDPNLTDKKFPGNPTRSYRTRQPLRVVGEILDREPHPAEVNACATTLRSSSDSASRRSTTERDNAVDRRHRLSGPAHGPNQSLSWHPGPGW